MKDTCLIVIDIQNIYFVEGPYKLIHPVETSLKAKEVLEFFRDKKMQVIHVKHNFEVGDNYPNKLEGLRDIHKNVAPIVGEIVVSKDFPNSFFQTELQNVLESMKIKTLIVVGMMSHMCIDTTVRAAKDYGYEVILLEDACTTKDMATDAGTIKAETVHNVFMGALSGMFAKVMSVNKGIELLRKV